MDLTSLLVGTLAGGGGGFLGDMLKKNGLGTIGNVVAGAVGGNGLPAILGALAPGLLGAADAAGGGGTTSMIMSVVASLVGGTAGSLLGGLFKKAA